jgi:Mg2+ and Co2+ transporter CorA
MYDRISSSLQQIPSAKKTEKLKEKLKEKEKSKSKLKEKLSSEKRSTRKGKYQTVLDKLNTFYAKIEQFIPSSNKQHIADEFSDIQLDVVSIISELESIRSISSEKCSK